MALSTNPEKRAKQLANLRLYSAGCTGGPGAPKINLDFRVKCRAYMEKPGGGWDQVIALAESSPRYQTWALEFVGAYAYGRPPQRTELTGAEGAAVAIRFVEIAPVAQEEGV